MIYEDYQCGECSFAAYVKRRGEPNPFICGAVAGRIQAVNVGGTQTFFLSNDTTKLTEMVITTSKAHNGQLKEIWDAIKRMKRLDVLA